VVPVVRVESADVVGAAGAVAEPADVAGVADAAEPVGAGAAALDKTRHGKAAAGRLALALALQGPGLVCDVCA